MKILVLQLKRFGDLILTAPALASLRAAHPTAKVTLIVADGCGQLAPALPGVDEVLVYRRNGNNSALWFKALLRRYDVCLDFTGNDRSAFFTLLSKARRRIAFAWVRKNGKRASFYNEWVDSPVRERHTIDHYLDLVAPLGAGNDSPEVTLHAPKAAKAEADRLLSAGNVTGEFVLVHPGTARAEKYWLPERWATVIDWCRQELGLPIVITGSPDAFEQEHLGTIRKLLAPSGTLVADLSGKLDFLTLPAVIDRAGLVLSVDSAPMHLAAALHKPQVALFGPTNPFHWHPRNSLAKVLAGGREVSPSELQPRTAGGTMAEISTGSVIDAISSLMSLSRTRPK